jgi:hypothetical protein
MNEEIEIRLIRAPWYKGAEILVRQGNAIGTLMMTEQPESSVVNPTLAIEDTAAQVLMDDLWNAGFRPTEGTGSAGSLRATEKHLNDFRKIVSKQMGIDL